MNAGVLYADTYERAERGAAHVFETGVKKILPEKYDGNTGALQYRL